MGKIHRGFRCWNALPFMSAPKAYAVVATGETAIYANILLKKGVVQ